MQIQQRKKDWQIVHKSYNSSYCKLIYLSYNRRLFVSFPIVYTRFLSDNVMFTFYLTSTLLLVS